MINFYRIVLTIVVFLMVLCCVKNEEPAVYHLRKIKNALRPLCQPMKKPGPSDWLAMHREPGQTFNEYLKSNSVRLDEKRKKIYVQPIGDLSTQQQEIVEKAADFLGLFYNCSIVKGGNLPLRIVAPEGRRIMPGWGNEQLLTTYILDTVLKPSLPDDAAAYLSFTAADLWPGEGWNFVFGQASLRDRVGVWSLYRLGNPEYGEAEEHLCLRRTLKLAVHETGHMFGLQHCTAFQCGMNGSNHLGELDGQPLYFCAECTAKVCWATGADPVKWAETLQGFLESVGLREDAEYYRKVILSLKTKGLADNG
jgi:archaemetzincin